jgi:hypothetical protein
MPNGKVIGKISGLVIFVVVLLLTTQCATKTVPAPNLPKDILGISVGMSKADAQKRLEEIAQFEREDVIFRDQIILIAEFSRSY